MNRPASWRWWRQPVFAAVAAVLLASCGGGGGGSSPPAVQEPPLLPGEYRDPLSYSNAPNGALAAPQEGKAVVAKTMTLGNQVINYTATTGHLTASDPVTGQPAVSFFYVAYTAGANPAQRPVTFFYNGGPGSSSLWLHLGSFGPRRLVTPMPASTVPSPVQVVDNQETLLHVSDLVFVDAVGTGFSQAIAPRTNNQFWGVDSDAAAFRDFVRRYVEVNQRQASPKYLFGESYGAPRTGVLANLLELAGVRLSGIVLQSAVMNYHSNCGVLAPGTTSCEGYIPSYAATSAYFQRTNPAPADPLAFLNEVRLFSSTDYRSAVAAYLGPSKTAPPASTVNQLNAYTGLSTALWTSNLSMGPGVYRAQLMPGTMIGRYDARVNAPNGTPLAADNDPSLTVVNAAFSTTIHNYIKNELRYSAKTQYATFSDIINQWNFSHDGRTLPDTLPDVAAAMALNPALKVVAMSGHYDLATPFYQTELDLGRLGSNPNVIIRNYGAGHMSYLDDAVRSAQRGDMITLYNVATVLP